MPFPLAIPFVALQALKSGGGVGTDRDAQADVLDQSTLAEAVQHSGEIPASRPAPPLPLSTLPSLGIHLLVIGVLCLFEECHSFLLGLVLWGLRTQWRWDLYLALLLTGSHCHRLSQLIALGLGFFICKGEWRYICLPDGAFVWVN